MNVLYRNALFIFCICGSYSVKYDYRKQQLDCVKICDASKKHCRQPPDRCGDCLPNYSRDFDGNCKPWNDIDSERREKEFSDPMEGPVSKRNDDAASDLTIVAVMKKQNEINYVANQSSSDVQQTPASSVWSNDVLIIALIACLSAAAVLGIIITIICCCKMRKSAKETSDYDYPGYGSMDYKGSVMETKSAGDRKLVQSAQMYHYQHQKQQMLEMEKNHNAITKSGSETNSDEENEGDEYTIYECPGLATSGELEVPNPLFSEPAATNHQHEIPVKPTEIRDENLVNGHKDP